MTFLEAVAKDLFQKNGGPDFSRYIVVFPNKRAAAFFNEYLYRQVGGVVWAPQYLSIEDLFISLSDYFLVDPIEAVCRLYKIFQRHVNSGETLDLFWPWGEQLLSDFDDIDKKLPLAFSAESLLQNVKDLHELDIFDYLSAEQKEALLTVSRNSSEESSFVQKRFGKLWQALYPIYRDFNEELASEGLAYAGALQRRVVKELPTRGDLSRRFVFVGFNILTLVERQLFEEMKKRDWALFYWDYDSYYVDEERHLEAGGAMRDNLRDFPNALPRDFFNSFGQPKDLEIVQANTENVQAYYVPTWVKENLTQYDHRKTAVVLCNENLLESVIHALPSAEVSDVNLTKGYPVSRTRAYQVLEDSFDEIKLEESTTSEVLQLLMKKVLMEACESQILLEAYETQSDEDDIPASAVESSSQEDRARAYDKFIDLLNAEALFHIYTTLNRLCTLVEKGLLEIQVNTLHQLLRQMLLAQTIPFEGDPLIGVQIMGLLETRCLDFDHILMLSCNETYLPQAKTADSFIPYLLRKAYGLTLPEQKTAATSYHFYRLIQRAKKVTFVYNSSDANSQPSDRSRYLLQLLLSRAHPIKQLALVNNTQKQREVNRVYKKPADLYSHLLCTDHKERPYISPSSLNRFLSCPLEFYYHDVAKLRQEELTEDDIDGRVFGNLFHLVAQTFYKSLLLGLSPQDAAQLEQTWIDLPVDNALLRQRMGDHDFIHKIIDVAIEKEGATNDILVREVLRRQLDILLREDAKLSNLRILGLEHLLTKPYKVHYLGQDYEVPVGGIIDRLDSYEQSDGRRVVRILDYKTGRNVQKAKNIESMFSERGEDNRPKYFFQIFLYGLIAKEQIAKGAPVSVQLFHPYRKNHYFIGYGNEPYIISDDEFKQYDEMLLDLLDHRIFNSEKPFMEPEKVSACQYCDFRILCQKEMHR